MQQCTEMATRAGTSCFTVYQPSKYFAATYLINMRAGLLKVATAHPIRRNEEECLLC